MRVCVTTAYDQAYAEMGALCEASLLAYVQAQGLDIKVVRGRVTDRPPAWNKIKVVESLFDHGYDFVFWVDADAVVMRRDIDIRAEIEEGRDLYLAAHQIELRPMPGMLVRLDVPNTGVMLLRNSPWMRAFLAEVWERKEYLTHRWWENAAVIDLLGYHRLLDPQRVNAPDPGVMARVKWLDVNWNSIPGDCEGADPIIRHHTRAASFEERKKAMQADLERAR